MSYIAGISTNQQQMTQQMKLRQKQDKLLADICKIVGSKKFTFSDAYINKVHPRVGVGEMSYSTITRKYVYVSCFLQYGNNEDCTEWGALIKKYPVCYNKCSGKFVNKVPLTDLFTSDLEKILEEIKFYLWWESRENLPKVRVEYNRLIEIEAKYNKMVEDLGYEPQTDKTDLF